MNPAGVVSGIMGMLAAVPLILGGATQHCDDIWPSLLSHPEVRPEINKAWVNTKEGTPAEEEWQGKVFKCEDHYSVEVGHSGKFWTVDPEDAPPNEKFGCVLVAGFHTHPGGEGMESHAGVPELGGDPDKNYDFGPYADPSNDDFNLAHETGLPSLIVYGNGSNPDTAEFVYYNGDGVQTPCTEPTDPGKKTETGEAPTLAESLAETLESIGRWFGDPHGITYDGFLYDFQFPGDYVLSDSLVDEFQVQVAQEPVKNVPGVSRTKAVAARVDGASVQITREILVVDGELIDLPAQRTFRTPDGGEIVVEGRNLDVRWADGTRMVLRNLSLVISPSESRRGTLQGLLGNFDANPDNDLVVNGSSLLDDGDLNFGELLDLAMVSRVAPGTSLFTYGPGESATEYTLEDMPAFPMIGGFLPADVREAAKARCEAAGVDDVMLPGCILDVGVTNDQSWADTAGELSDAVERLDAPSGDPPLVVAARARDTEAVKRLLGEGAQVDATDDRGRTALAWAAGVGPIDGLRALLSAGADPRRGDDTGTTPMHFAAEAGHDDIVAELLSAGSDATPRDREARTPLMAAAGRGHTAVMRRLLAAGTPVDAVDDAGGTAIGLAIVGGRPAAVSVLLEAGADANRRDPAGARPLHRAALWGQIEIADLLLAAGADRTAEDANGNTAADIARLRGFEDLARILE